MGASTVAGFKDPDSKVFSEPVQFETCNRLSGAVLDDGRGVLTWMSGSNVRVAVVEPGRWLTTNVVTADMAVTAFSPGPMYSVTSWADGNNHYILAYLDTANDDVQFWRSTDSLASWHYVNTLHARDGDNFKSHTPGMAKPLILPSGRWVMTGSYQIRIISNDNVTRAGVHTSDDKGATWAIRFHQGYGGSSTGTHAPSNHVVQNPTTGRLYMQTTGSYSGTNYRGMHYSDDEGTTWTRVDVSDYFHPFVDDGEHIYGFVGNDAHKLLDPLDLSTRVAAGTHLAGTWARYERPGNTDMFFDMGSRIYYKPPGGWQVGALGFG